MIKIVNIRRSPPEVFLGKGTLKICSKFTGEHHCRSLISIKCDFTLRHGCSPVNLLRIFRTHFSKNTSRGLLLDVLNVWKDFKMSNMKDYHDSYLKADGI